MLTLYVRDKNRAHLISRHIKVMEDPAEGGALEVEEEARWLELGRTDAPASIHVQKLKHRPRVTEEEVLLHMELNRKHTLCLLYVYRVRGSKISV